MEFDGHTATVQWEDGSVEDLQKNILTKQAPAQEPAKTTTELPSSEPKPRTMVQWNNEAEEVKPVKTEEEKKSMLSKIKERLVTALKGEGFAITTPGGATISTGKNSAQGISQAKELEKSTGDQLTVVDTKTGKKQQA